MVVESCFVGVIGMVDCWGVGDGRGSEGAVNGWEGRVGKVVVLVVGRGCV